MRTEPRNPEQNVYEMANRQSAVRSKMPNARATADANLAQYFLTFRNQLHD